MKTWNFLKVLFYLNKFCAFYILFLCLFLYQMMFGATSKLNCLYSPNFWRWMLCKDASHFSYGFSFIFAYIMCSTVARDIRPSIWWTIKKNFFLKNTEWHIKMALYNIKWKRSIKTKICFLVLGRIEEDTIMKLSLPKSQNKKKKLGKLRKLYF